MPPGGTSWSAKRHGGAFTWSGCTRTCSRLLWHPPYQTTRPLPKSHLRARTGPRTGAACGAGARLPPPRGEGGAGCAHDAIHQSTMSVSRSFNLSTSCAVRLPPREGPILSALAAAAHPCRPLRDARARARLEGGGTTNHPSACAAEVVLFFEAGAPPRGGLWRQGACRGGRARRAAGAWPGAALEGAQARPEARGRLTSFRCCRGALGRRQGAQRRAGARGERQGCAQARRRALGGAERGQPRDGAAPLRQALTGRRKAAEGAGAGQRQRARGRQGRGFLHWGRHGDAYDVVCLEHVRGLAQEAAHPAKIQRLSAADVHCALHRSPSPPPFSHTYTSSNNTPIKNTERQTPPPPPPPLAISRCCWTPHSGSWWRRFATSWAR